MLCQGGGEGPESRCGSRIRFKSGVQIGRLARGRSAQHRGRGRVGGGCGGPGASGILPRSDGTREDSSFPALPGTSHSPPLWRPGFHGIFPCCRPGRSPAGQGPGRVLRREGSGVSSWEDILLLPRPGHEFLREDHRDTEKRCSCDWPLTQRFGRGELAGERETGSLHRAASSLRLS